jgi:hypothetical protein
LRRPDPGFNSINLIGAGETHLLWPVQRLVLT